MSAYCVSSHCYNDVIAVNNSNLEEYWFLLSLNKLGRIRHDNQELLRNSTLG